MSTTEQGTVKPTPGISKLTNTQWSKPSFTLPIPSLEFLFHLECDMESFHHIGAGPHGDRSTVIFKGGRFEGPKMRGSIMAGGGDWEIVRNSTDPTTGAEVQTAHLDTRYNLQTHDGAVIYLQTTGTRTGRREIIESLGEKEVSADQYRMRLHVTMETGDERYEWVNRSVFMASSGRVGDQVIYDCYQIV